MNPKYERILLAFAVDHFNALLRSQIFRGLCDADFEPTTELVDSLAVKALRYQLPGLNDQLRPCLVSEPGRSIADLINDHMRNDTTDSRYRPAMPGGFGGLP